MRERYRFGFEISALILLLCAIVNKDARKLSVSKWIVACLTCCVLYFVSWVFYYIGITNIVVILGLTIPPCLAFFFFAVDRKNMIAIVPNVLFTVCHLIYAFANFIL